MFRNIEKLQQGNEKDRQEQGLQHKPKYFNKININASPSFEKNNIYAKLGELSMEEIDLKKQSNYANECFWIHKNWNLL